MKHAFGLDIPQTLEDICDPTRMALMVYDMQAGIFRQLPTAPQIMQRVTEVVRAARDAGYRILHTRYVSLPLELTGATHLRMAMAWQHEGAMERSLAGLRFAGDAILTDVATICRLLRKSAPGQPGRAERESGRAGVERTALGTA